MGWQDAPVVGKSAWESAPLVEAPKTEAKPSMTRADLVRRELMGSVPVGFARGLKDIVDTGAGYLSRLGGKEEQARVRASNEAAQAEYAKTTEGMIAPAIARVGGNVTAVAPLTSFLGAGVGLAAPRVGSAIASGGMTTGAAPTTVGAKAADLAIRTAGGGVAGGLSAGAVNPEDAGKGAAIGAALPGALKVAGYTGQKIGQGVAGATKNVLGVSTGVGAEPLAQAFKAGKAGNQDFVRNMRGNAEITDVLDRAKVGLDAMRAEKSAAYRSGMVPIKGDQSVLKLDGLYKALDDATGTATFKGQVKSQSAADAVAKMRAAVDEWKGLDPAQFHTPEGLDALKQKLGGILESIPIQERTARLAAGKVYTAAKSTIEDQAPTYAKVMRDYSSASEQITEIERALSLGDKASKDTAMRKLQSLMRNNVQTNYGNRLELANKLEQQGGVDLLPSLAGQAVNSWTPRSLAGQAGSVITGLTALQNPLALSALTIQSPRLMGEAAYGLGRMAGGTGQAANALAQRLPGAVGGMPLDVNALAQMGYRVAPVALAGSGR